MAHSRKFYVLVNESGEFICDINKTTLNFNEALRWVSEQAAVAAYQRAKDRLPDSTALTQVEVPFPLPSPMRYYEDR